MQTAWERSVAATARSGEDVHFWSSLALDQRRASAQQIVNLLMVVVGVFLILDGKLSVGALVASTMLAGRVLAPIAGIAAVMTRATQTLIVAQGDRSRDGARARTAAGRSYVARRDQEGRIAFENVSFRYPGSRRRRSTRVSFKIEPGERVGIIGRVGSGKTTVGRLWCGFYDPPAKAASWSTASMHANTTLPTCAPGIGFVLQDTDLFFGKLRDNITLGRPAATDEEVLAAARLAGVESFIAGHPLGYDMLIAEGGRSLSGGQKQAIGLARVLIRKPEGAVPR